MYVMIDAVFPCNMDDFDWLMYSLVKVDGYITYNDEIEISFPAFMNLPVFV